MPILEYHLNDGQYSDGQLDELLAASSHRYAEVLKCPLDRVRVYAHMHQPAHVAVAGKRVSRGAPAAPYFHFLVLEGRPLEECEALLKGFTDLVVDILGAERSLVRGGCWPIPPRYWAIGGLSASALRAEEIRQRALAADGERGAER